MTGPLQMRWKNDPPDAEWSSGLPDGTEIVYVAGYPEGVVIRVGGEKVAFLTPGQASRMGQRLIRFSKLAEEGGGMEGLRE